MKAGSGCALTACRKKKKNPRTHQSLCVFRTLVRRPSPSLPRFCGRRRGGLTTHVDGHWIAALYKNQNQILFDGGYLRHYPADRSRHKRFPTSARHQKKIRRHWRGPVPPVVLGLAASLWAACWARRGNSQYRDHEPSPGYRHCATLKGSCSAGYDCTPAHDGSDCIFVTRSAAGPGPWRFDPECVEWMSVAHDRTGRDRKPRRIGNARAVMPYGHRPARFRSGPSPLWVISRPSRRPPALLPVSAG